MIIAKILKELLARPGKSGGTVAEEVAAVLIEQALNGNTTCLKELLERVDGKAPNAKDEDNGAGKLSKIDELIAGLDARSEK